MNPQFNGISPHALKQLHENATWYQCMGIALIVIGFFATIFASVSTLFSVVYLGFLLIFLGIAEAIKSSKITLWKSFALHLLLAILFTACGAFIVFYPTINAITLTLLLAISFIIAGIFRLFFAFTHTVPHKGWLIFNGACTLLLGILIWQQWPVSGLWVIGMLIGINAIFTGWTWIMLASIAKKLEYTGKE